ncbi:MAG: hypothetical protein Q8J68_02785 [Methanolobus sp.]|uniref:hypothetical protein n=1 Tax=Methanolobus sp. TaxID=1874737 RepID=UPI00272FC200|nr:hypothetical protein [Methanolobus sp.]MDP2216198.1 hypothetical protein [Methanolobus sp.]
MSEITITLKKSTMVTVVLLLAVFAYHYFSLRTEIAYLKGRIIDSGVAKDDWDWDDAWDWDDNQTDTDIAEGVDDSREIIDYDQPMEPGIR